MTDFEHELRDLIAERHEDFVLSGGTTYPEADAYRRGANEALDEILPHFLEKLESMSLIAHGVEFIVGESVYDSRAALADEYVAGHRTVEDLALADEIFALVRERVAQFVAGDR